MAKTPTLSQTPPGRRSWSKGDRSKVSVMHVFRAAHAEHDSRKATTKTADGDAQITPRSKQRREGLSEVSLKAHLQADLNSLMNTIRLDAAVSLADAPYVARSIVNYGFRDLSDVTSQELHSQSFIQTIRQSLLDHEPRLIPDSIDIAVNDESENTRQRLAIYVSAELMGDPVDIPVRFDAEVDLGAGKLRMSGLQVQA